MGAYFVGSWSRKNDSILGRGHHVRDEAAGVRDFGLSKICKIFVGAEAEMQ